MTCLHCGASGSDRIFRAPGTRVAKRDNDMRPDGFYFFAFCEDCRHVDKRDFSPLWLVYPDRLKWAPCQTPKRGIRNLFSGA